ncbi:hypothetical protein K2173_008420 [Erythroxylum novogranatense]|uniref:DCD domain-containing protein n=1 Tax=Erythroxylum novogranatense TaxID=1862640 RepID=A0AAV8U923_9ROSI|nr:hypothetical protein K2173_008420 [Erythroxylum novogranatense]
MVFVVHEHHSIVTGADKTHAFGVKSPGSVMNNSSAKNLTKSQLGGVIFGCKSGTIQECLTKQLFGLPSQHFMYVKNIDPGLPLFLFNYSDRKLHGIFEAVSCGQMNIDPYGWTADGSHKTLFPAQVQVRVRLQCQPLLEEHFKPKILDNYYSHHHFYFELDHTQASQLISLFTSIAVTPSPGVPQNSKKLRAKYQVLQSHEVREDDEGFKPLSALVKRSHRSVVKRGDPDHTSPLYEDNQSVGDQLDRETSEEDERDLIYQKLQKLALSYQTQDLSLEDHMKDSADVIDIQFGDKGSPKDMIGPEKAEDSASTLLSCQSIIHELVQEMEELKTFKREQCQKMDYLEHKLVEAEVEIQQLKDRCMMLQSRPSSSSVLNDETGISSDDEVHLDPTESIYLVGGYDGESMSSTLDLYFPSKDFLKSLRPMSCTRSYTSVASLNKELYVFGGGNGCLWYDTVESYNPDNDQWTLQPSLTKKRGGLAGATLNEKIFAVGGGNGVESFADVEMLDLYLGRWILTRSMLHRRFSHAAVELNGALYTCGGYDGNDYLKSAERFDPREHSWSRLPSMNSRRGCHTLVVLNEKLYAIGGFDGNNMVATTEIYDPRLDLWIDGYRMNNPRGYATSVAVKDCIYVIGGVKADETIIDTVEHFKEGQGWHESGSRTIGKRCFLSAITLQV